MIGNTARVVFTWPMAAESIKRSAFSVYQQLQQEEEKNRKEKVLNHYYSTLPNPLCWYETPVIRVCGYCSGKRHS